MDLRTLRYFIAVLEAGSLSRAAGSLYIAQPALTAQIKKLEAELGAQLFDRSHAGVTPTPAGMQLYEDARRLLSDADAVRERIQRLPQGPEGSVTVAVPFLLASLLLGPVLASLKASHPRIRVFVLDDLSLMVKKAMLDRRADVGILVDTAQVDGLDCRPLARESIFVCGFDHHGGLSAQLRAPRALKAVRGRRGKPAVANAPAPHPEIAFADAARLPLVLQSRRFAIRQRVEEAAASLGLPLNLVHEHDSARVIRSLYVCGAGFTFTPACALGDNPRGGEGWVAARVVEPALQRSYTIATPADRTPEPAAQVVAEALAEQTARLIRDGLWEAELLADGSGSRA